MGYATVCRMRDDSDRVVEERYLDANGDPVARYGDYYGLSYDLVALLKRTINEYKRVTVFMNQQYLCKKEHGRYCSIQGPIETIRRIWEETNAPMVFCCNESFVDAINGNDEDSQDIGNSFRWRNGGFVVKGREQCE